MLETALLSTLSPATRRSFALPLSIAAHAAVLTALPGASLWREEPLAEPPMPIIFVRAPTSAAAGRLLDGREQACDGSKPPGDPTTGAVPGAPVTGESAEAPIGPGGNVRAPVLLYRVEPDYPEAARQIRLQGIVCRRSSTRPGAWKGSRS